MPFINVQSPVQVVEGNHEANAPWKNEVQKILSNARFLRNESVVIDGLSIHGKGFFWNMKTANPHDELIPDDVDVLVAHNPAKGYVDNDGGRQHGCESSAQMVSTKLPRAYICGHIHFARGAQKVGSVLFVNGANVIEKKGVPGPEASGPTGSIRTEMTKGERSYRMLDDGRPILVEI